MFPGLPQRAINEGEMENYIPKLTNSRGSCACEGE